MATRKRLRSPNYPAISLQDAIRRVSKIHQLEHQNPAPRETMVQHLDYKGLTGASIPVLSALTKYGLLEDAGNKELRVSELAMSILFPQSEDEKRDAIRKAAFMPPIFAEIREKWPSHQPSEANLKAYLVRRGFAQNAVDEVIQRYQDTMEMLSDGRVENEDSGDDGNRQGYKEDYRREEEAGANRGNGRRLEDYPTPGLRVSFTDDRLEVSAGLYDAESVDRLIKILEANKPLLPNKVSEADDSRDE